MQYKILVPPGIGDFSWLWSKLSTTGDSYDIEYADSGPDRLGAFLELLPKDKVLCYRKSSNFRFYFDTGTLTGMFAPNDRWKVDFYQNMDPDHINVLEPNTHLEHGRRIEEWLPDIPTINFHYEIPGLSRDPRFTKKYFIVHLSSYAVKRSWNYYDIPIWIDLISMVQKQTGWRPVFIGADYDDFAKACFQAYSECAPNGWSARSVIGQTENLLPALELIQSSKFFMGAVSSGLTMLANVLSVPSVSWWPRPALPSSWPDMNVHYQWFLWKNPEHDKAVLSDWLTKLSN